MFIVSEDFTLTYPHASAGILVMSGVSNPAECAQLQAKKAMIEGDLRRCYGTLSRQEIATLPEFRAYNAHYRRFGKSYHVQLQLESIALRGKALPRGAALVEAMFMAEVQDRLLTAGHDVDSLRLPLQLKVASGEESYRLLSGADQATKDGDMMMADEEGVVSSVVYGPDSRTRIRPDTEGALFAVYAPAGILPAAVRAHLRNISSNVRMVSPSAEVESLEVYHVVAPGHVEIAR